MGVRGTGDYLTARAANPRTGLISPSVAALTPRTPLTPGEALSLYSDDNHTTYGATSTVKTTPTSESPSQRPRPGGPRSRWRQNSKGWITESANEIAVPKARVANTSVLRSDFNASEDSFVVRMPTAKDPQPYLEPGQTEAQRKAVEYYREKGRQLSSELNGRMNSVGAGPRKFAAATEALRNYKAVNGQYKGSNKFDKSTISKKEDPFTDPKALPCLPTQSSRTISSGSVDSVARAIHSLPGNFSKDSRATTPNSIHSNGTTPIYRKPVGSPPKKDRSDTINSTTSATEKEVYINKPEDPNRPRQSPNTTRFQDLRQLPRVRIIHPDATESMPREEDFASKETRVFTWPESSKPLPYPDQAVVTSQHVPVSTSLTPLETQIMGLLAWAITTLINLAKPKQESKSSVQGIGILQAVHLVSSSDTDITRRFTAAKTLAVAFLRVVLMVGCFVAVVRVGTAVGRVLEIVFYPVGVLVVVLRWGFGYG